MSSHAHAQVVEFQIVRFIEEGKNETTIVDVEKFISQHSESKETMIVKIDPTGIGQCFADLLEQAGFSIRREFPLRAHP